jgi:hypothetical protein
MAPRRTARKTKSKSRKTARKAKTARTKKARTGKTKAPASRRKAARKTSRTKSRPAAKKKAAKSVRAPKKVQARKKKTSRPAQVATAVGVTIIGTIDMDDLGGTFTPPKDDLFSYGETGRSPLSLSGNSESQTPYGAPDMEDDE